MSVAAMMPVLPVLWSGEFVRSSLTGKSDSALQLGKLIHGENRRNSCHSLIGDHRGRSFAGRPELGEEGD
jgi:hypothetical protein